MADTPPVVDSGDNHSKVVAGGMKLAHELRMRYQSALRSDEVSFSKVVSLSKQQDLKALGKIRLLKVLSDRPGWSEATALEAMTHLGLGPSDNILDIRRNASRVDAFEKMMESPPDRWRARPQMPQGWPFFGKLSEVLSPDNNIPDVPEELLDSGTNSDDDLDESFLENLA